MTFNAGEQRFHDAVDAGRTTQPDAPGLRRLVLHVLLLACLLGLAAAVRLHGLSNESVWYDEFNSIRYLDAPTVRAFLDEQQEYNDEMVPLYFVLQYYWARALGDAPANLRLLSILFGLAALAVLYCVGNGLFGPVGAFISTMCMALSPFMIYLDQGLRPYSLVVLLGLISGASLLRMLRGGGAPWWGLNALANVLLLWTHLFGCWLLVAEALFLVATRWRWPARLLVWGGAQALGIAPVAILVSGWRLDPPTGTLPGPVSMLDHALGRDMSPVLITVRRCGALLCERILPGFASFLVEHTGAVYGGLLILFAACVLHLGYRAMRGADGVAAFNGIRRVRIETVGWLLVWLVLPIVLLFVFAAWWSPEAYARRYTAYGAPALYLLVGGGAATVGPFAARVLLTALLAGVMAVQGYLGVAVPTRPDFIGVAKYIDARAKVGEGILYYPPLTHATFQYNLGDAGLPVRTARDLSELLEHAQRRNEAGQSSWVVVAEIDAPVDLAPLETYADALGKAGGGRFFPGSNQIYVQFFPAGGARPETGARNPAGNSAERFLRLLAEAAAQEARGETNRAIRVYRQALNEVPGADAPRAAFAEKLAETGWTGSLQPEQALARYVHQAVDAAYTLLFHEQRQEDALAFYARFAEEHPGNRLLQLGYITALQQNGRLERALEVARAAAERMPGVASVRVALGQTLRMLDRTAEARRVFEQVIEAFPGDPAPYTGLGELLVETGKPLEAIPVLRRAVELRAAHGDPGPVTRLRLLEALCETGNQAAAAAALAKCDELDVRVPPALRKRVEQGCTGNR